MSLSEALIKDFKSGTNSILKKVKKDRLPVVVAALEDMTSYSIALLTTSDEGSRKRFQSNIGHCAGIIASETAIVQIEVMSQFQNTFGRVVNSIVSTAFKSLIVSL